MRSNIVLIGLTGCGKTALGKRLSRMLNMPFIDMDSYIEEHYGAIKDLFEKGEEYFRDIESKVAKEVAQRKGTIISTGGGVVLRESNMEALKSTGIVFYLDRPIEEIISTIDTSNRPLLKDGKEVIYRLKKEREHLYIRYCDYRIYSSNMEYALSAISSIWKENQKQFT